MSIFEVMDLLEDEMENSPNVPLSNKKRVDLERFYQLMDQLREEVPEEIRKAELLLREKQFILDDAHEQAEVAVKEAERRAKQLVEEHEITRQAQRYAEELVASAQNNSREVRQSARAYADDVLEDIETYLEEYRELIQKNRDSLGARYRETINQQTSQRDRMASREEREPERNRNTEREAEPEKGGIVRRWGRKRQQVPEERSRNDYDDYDE